MELLIALLLGIVQGITEFLPISSSGHLVILHELISVPSIESLGFDVAVHIGTFLALLVYFWKDVIRYVRAFLQSFISFQVKTDTDQKIAWLLLVGTIPTALIGFFFESIIEESVRSVAVVAWALIIGGLLFFLIEKIGNKERDITGIRLFDAVIIGCAQAAALIPGTSRSGITIIAGLWRNLTREAAARFSFLLSMPIIAGAGFKVLLDSLNTAEPVSVALYVTGAGGAALSGFIVIHYFLKFIQKHSFVGFGWYRIILGGIILLTLV